MPQVSKYPLDKVIQKEIFRQFWVTISRLKSSDDVAAFFSDLLTETEEIMLAKRCAIALLILRGKRAIDIAKTLHVSYSTIRSTALWVKHASPQSRTLFKLLLQEQNWGKLFDRIDALLDTLPPLYGSDWSRVGKEKWKRKMERVSLDKLR